MHREDPRDTSDHVHARPSGQILGLAGALRNPMIFRVDGVIWGDTADNMTPTRLPQVAARQPSNFIY